jgi:Iap family predicted aminopeptidase
MPTRNLAGINSRYLAMLVRKMIMSSVLLLWSGVFTVHGSAWGDNQGLISTLELIQEDILNLDCSKKDRLPAVQMLLEKMGAQASEISIERFKRVENVTVRKQGNSEGVIIVGAHYDRASLGCGAVDNWSGVIALAHIYRSVRQLTLKRTIVFVAFGREEDGRLGSKAMADSIEKSQRQQYCAMINLDSLGMGKPQVLENISSKKLTLRAANVASQMNMPFAKHSVYGPDSDSSSFIEKSIPAITIHGLAGEVFKIIHTSNDQPKEVNATSVYFCYRLALALVANVDECSCNEFR